MTTNSNTYDKELKSSNGITSGNIFKVFLSILLPVYFYALLNYGYDFFDTFILSVSDNGNIESIFVLAEVKKMLSTLGAGLSSGALIFIAQKMGAKKLDEANHVLSMIFKIVLLLSIVMLSLLIPFAPLFLKLINTPISIIVSSSGYFAIQVVVVAVEWFNGLFIGIQKAKGRAFKLFYINIGVVAIKISLSILFTVLKFQNIIVWLALATLIAQSFMFVFAMVNLFNKKSILSVNFKRKFNLEFFKKILQYGIPIFVGNFLFHYAKVFLNAQVSDFYGVAVLYALGICNMFFSFNQQFLNATKSATSIMVGQNYGAKNYTRVTKTYRNALALSFGMISIFFIIATFLSKGIVSLLNADNAEMIVTLINVEKYELLFVAILSCSDGLLYGIGKTKLNMLFNILRTVVLRIPLLYFFYYVLHYNYTLPATITVISNAISAILMLMIALIAIKKIKDNNVFTKEFSRVIG